MDKFKSGVKTAFWLVWCITMLIIVFSFGILVGLTAEMELQPQCINIPNENSIVITKTDLLMKELKENGN